MWSFSRASSTWSQDADGIFYSVESNVPRLNSGGLALEIGSTNLLLHNRTLSNAAWIKEATTITKNAVGIDGSANSATTLTAYTASIPADVYQHVDISTGNYYVTGSIFIRKTTSATTHPRFYFTLWTADWSVYYQADWIINTDTGSATAVPSHIPIGTCVVEDFGQFWRVSIIHSSAGAYARATLWIRTAASSDGVTAQSGLTGSCVVDAPQIDLGRSRATTPIMTTTAVVTRPNEFTTCSFAQWGATQNYTIFIEIEGHQATGAANEILSMYSAAANRVRIYKNDLNQVAIYTNINSSPSTTTFTVNNPLSGVKIAVSVSRAALTVIKSVNGTNPTNALSSAAFYTDITTIGIGRDQAGSNPPPQSMTVKRIEFWPRAMTGAELAALTA